MKTKLRVIVNCLKRSSKEVFLKNKVVWQPLKCFKPFLKVTSVLVFEIEIYGPGLVTYKEDILRSSSYPTLLVPTYLITLSSLT